MSELSLIVANLSRTVRRETVNGREFIIASATLIVAGVLNGSKGPLYYPPDEIAKNPSDWNHIPITIYHPKSGALNISARDPEVLKNQGIGHVFRAKYNADNSGKLTAELWFDVENTRRADDKYKTDVLSRLEKGLPIGLSTGLFTENVPAPNGAVHNGKDRSGRPYTRAYTHVARNHKPDHLAILPDQAGACSIDDGCGVLVNEDGNIFPELIVVNVDPKSVLISTLTTLNQRGLQMRLTAEQKAEIMNGLVQNCTCGGIDMPWKGLDHAALNAKSDGELMTMDACKKWAMDKDKTTKNQGPPSKEFTDAIGNRHVFNADKNQWETSLGNNNFPNNPPPVTTTAGTTAVSNGSPIPGFQANNLTNNQQTQQKQTMQQWLAAMPPEAQPVWNSAVELHNQSRLALIEQLTANMQGDAKNAASQVYSAMPLDQLKVLVMALPPVQNAQQQNATVSNWFGSAAPAPAPVTNEEPLTIPVMQFDDPFKRGRKTG